jgi:hypothetical protein
MIATMLFLLAASATPTEPGATYVACLHDNGSDPGAAAPEAEWQAAWQATLRACRETRAVWWRWHFAGVRARHPDWSDVHISNNVENVLLSEELYFYPRFRNPPRLVVQSDPLCC